MPLRSSTTAAAALSAVLAVASAALCERAAPWPSADTSCGSEAAFALRGLHPRELPPRQAPLRWTKEQAVFRFRYLPTGPARLEVRVHGHRGPVMIAAGGATLGVVPADASGADFVLTLPKPTLEVELRTDGFVAGDGRRLGALLDRLTIVPDSAPLLPSAPVALVFLLPALTAAIGAMAVGLGSAAAVAVSAVVSASQCAALWPCGLLRGDYARDLAGLLVAGLVLTVVFARFVARRSPGAAAMAFLSLLLAVLVQGVATTSPVMVVSDAVMHAHKLEKVARGDFFLTSETQHAHPFRFPYGVSFYALLAPLARVGFDPLLLVRAGAAVAGLLASTAVFAWLAPLGAFRAAMAVVLLQLLPGTFHVFKFGNFSNAFGQSMTVLFFVWWAGSTPGGWPIGAALLLLGCLGHLSSLIVLLVLAAAMAFYRRRTLGEDRTRLLALAFGLGLAALYYSRFAPLVFEQLPRLLEGGGQGRGASRSALDALMLQLQGIAGQWGLPAIILAAVGRPRPAGGPVDRDLIAFWLAGAVLAALAVVSPLEVRYLYALTLPVAVAAGTGYVSLWRSGPWLRLATVLLLGAQAVLASREIVEAVLQR